ncbi:unnamed protein product [Cyprideis torosa]|uniref:Uncharacterized protein n=1 Tax=Cyprideis torosa TaxID=163714 RepID=A0A7R8WX97_9CRUS|nr:unnamed protein product [Cyprideis torosa]CAG0908889.1 unnamed protein product [Cyprideis torosa]
MTISAGEVQKVGRRSCRGCDFQILQPPERSLIFKAIPIPLSLLKVWTSASHPLAPGHQRQILRRQ